MSMLGLRCIVLALAMLVNDTLVERSKGTGIEPLLAVSWQVMDQLRWRTLPRDGVEFQGRADADSPCR